MAYQAQMSHRDRRQRMRTILARLDAGESALDLAVEYDLSPRHILQTAKYEKEVQKRKSQPPRQAPNSVFALGAMS